jgi:transcriptional regulator with XRE-family HTH domain
LNRDIGLALKRLRIEKGLTQKELAAKVHGGLDYTYIGKIERGEQLPSLKILLRISEALDVPVDHFFRVGVASSSVRVPAIGVGGRENELQRELRQLHPDDLPLVIEIVRVLNRHRKAERKRGYPAPAEVLPLAAEDGPSYEEP